ncbi:hypothetical protein LCGC14_0735470 [marine sediment metagenome]|uniref:Aminoglycoside phosphotransferase domain-containing protein n=1 Tax=marine sediment metagenome TaxID=412755 RepID=A0A0F9Q8B8_9ZZZZ
MIHMKDYFDKNLIQNIYNSNEFKGWLLSRRWFGDKSTLSNLEFEVSIIYFNIISGKIFLTVIEIKSIKYTKNYFLPLIYYEKIQEILDPIENVRDNIIKLTNNTFSKKLAINFTDGQEVITLNLIEAEYCLFFWRKMLFDPKISEIFPSLSLELTLYSKQFEDEINLKKVQTLIEAGLYSDRFDFSIRQLGKGNTTNSLFQLDILNKSNPNQKTISFVLKSYKSFSESIEPSKLFVLLKNKFPNAPKIYGTIKLLNKETIGIIESVQNSGNLGNIYWNELNIMINKVFKDGTKDYSIFDNKSNKSKIIKENCVETLKVSNVIGNCIKNLHISLILPDITEYNIQSINSNDYLERYSDKLNSMTSELLKYMTQKPESAFFNLPKISSILIDVKDIIDKFRREFEDQTIKIQPVHQDLHMEQILYEKVDNKYNFYFIDFEGDPQLSMEEKKEKFPIEKDLASFLRALSYIKFNTLLGFIEKNLIKKDTFAVPEEILYNLFFRRAARPVDKILDVVLNVLNAWENKLMNKILKNLDAHYVLITYFYIERALNELNYEILFRPNKIIVPILGLKEIIDKN